MDEERALDESYMREALRLAEYARGRTSPNPLVGAVIVRDGIIVGSGWHRAAGEPHAEIHALRMAGELSRGATLYVTLEPCCHYGRTGPCAEAVIAAGIVRVVTALGDPNPAVAGHGIERLRAAGIAVATGICAEEARRQNEVFLKWVVTKRPFVTLKTAMTLDGKTASRTGASHWITGEAARTRVHEWRDAYDVILVGIGTVLADDPSLTVRLPHRTGKNPVRVVLDSMARTPHDAKLLTDGAARTIVVAGERADPKRTALLQACGAEVVTFGRERPDIAALLDFLGAQELTSVFVEGGAAVHWSFLSAGLADKMHVFIAPMLMGGADAPTAVGGTGFASPQEALHLTDMTVEQIGADILVTGYPVKRGD
ncbi:bifunctional diaminohydroxyphosphoribosylaminopyrimidine deaminase/5-amino-6-(5-phosphoribosylamino)uracil reductase RibD [Selenomonas sp. F0473]|uniref:bifunctional diaminohydroxyphosphoribosylaminopyrimidine deaminase/5-amino-6-(5-phosphoribosylamino)uracil reductase RibD n=1 Tax=Selenomonas sp. F0473 TaxID=999423 RepID=UPI0025FA3301|nr:bifunctional diaminohydroxyphosphoribosylaminopyrimidine deaminase/5-amino-6-(5-phosphoribosylamino)uracil reductase RibD [Selenomonas sp. F0473]